MNDEAQDIDELVRRAKADREAFGRLYDLYYPVVHRYCRRRLFGLACVDDAVADTFLSVARSMARFTGTTELDFRCWLFRIAANTANQCARQSGRRDRRFGKAQDPSELMDDRQPENASILADEWAQVAAALNRLDDRSRTVLTLKYMESMEHEHIARVVNARPAAVRTILSRALSRLRDLLHVERTRVAKVPGGEV